MKELLKQFATYNAWANHKLVETILQLTENQQTKELPSSFKSLQGTMLHMWDAESIWWQRMKLTEHVIFPSENFKGTIRDIATGLLQQSEQWLDWVSNASDISLDHVFQYYTTKRELFKQPVYQIILHVCNHSTYHRGQLVNMLRQLGVEKIPATDFSLWSRAKRG